MLAKPKGTCSKSASASHLQLENQPESRFLVSCYRICCVPRKAWQANAFIDDKLADGTLARGLDGSSLNFEPAMRII
ncbi:hypothetical protein PSTT_13508 [Puccinia striiformis]|uniref:Uncharacterized protein n=1 Tax=Puccinia striiformis TaxID=27350 RepID=A0A2S4URN7_9BASI|nr:hypothetical protein PSTT_13508 [Puccinia striiformis]